MKSLKRKFIVSLIAIMFAIVALGTVTYAYWAKYINTDTTTQVSIGADDSTMSVVPVNNTQVLVPVGYENEVNSFSEIGISFTVDWRGSGSAATVGVLSIDVFSVKIKDDINFNTSDLKPLFTFTLQNTKIVRNTSSEHIMQMQFTNEPVNKKMSDALQNGKLLLGITFNVTPAPIVTP